MNKCEIKFTVDYIYAKEHDVIAYREDKTLMECQLRILSWKMEGSFATLSLAFTNSEERSEFVRKFSSTFNDCRCKEETTIYSVEDIGEFVEPDGTMPQTLVFLVNTEIIKIEVEI